MYQIIVKASKCGGPSQWQPYGPIIETLAEAIEARGKVLTTQTFMVSDVKVSKVLIVEPTDGQLGEYLKSARAKP